MKEDGRVWKDGRDGDPHRLAVMGAGGGGGGGGQQASLEGGSSSIRSVDAIIELYSECIVRLEMAGEGLDDATAAAVSTSEDRPGLAATASSNIDDEDEDPERDKNDDDEKDRRHLSVRNTPHSPPLLSFSPLTPSRQRIGRRASVPENPYQQIPSSFQHQPQQQPQQRTTPLRFRHLRPSSDSVSSLTQQHSSAYAFSAGSSPPMWPVPFESSTTESWTTRSTSITITSVPGAGWQDPPTPPRETPTRRARHHPSSPPTFGRYWEGGGGGGARRPAGPGRQVSFSFSPNEQEAWSERRQQGSRYRPNTVSGRISEQQRGAKHD
jgi:hypothetical protein